MRRPVRTRSARPPKGEKPAAPNAWRDRLAVLLALVTVGFIGAVFFLAKDRRFLMPGPLTSAHGAIENCEACHTKTGRGNLTWIRALVAGDPVADSKACLTCHKMPDTAFNAHSASADMLEHSTRRLTRVAARTPAPQSARAQSIVFPTDAMVAHGLHCATCHQEHQGAAFNLTNITNEQCRSCHVVKFDSFDGRHPEFDNYPFKRRTRIIYDHAGHFGKHFPEVAKTDPGRRIPETCSACHNSRQDKRVMAVAPFEQTCTACHLGQITGKERVSGPKGIAFLALPGLDLQTLRKKKASIGEWPDASEAELTPFMKVMIARTARGRALIEAVDRLNLQDLSRASNDQISAVTRLVWEIKLLFYALISGKASDVLADLNVGEARLRANLVADLTASIPRDVLVSAHQLWLPNLGREMANRKDMPGTVKPARRIEADQQPATRSAPPDTVAAKAAVAEPEGAGRKGDIASPKPEDARKAAVADGRPPSRAADQTDDLLTLTEEELRGIAAPAKGAGRASQPEVPVRKAEAAGARPPDSAASKADAQAPAAAPAGSEVPAPVPQTTVAAIGIQSDVEPESWAEYGGWYRQDYAIFYRPTGHRDKLIYSWLSLTGPKAPKGRKTPAAAVFDYLTSKDAPGSCTKCHSVDQIEGKGRFVNFAPPKIETKQGRFTNFIHEPHFGILDNRGCLTCHALERGRPYLKSYEHGNPKSFVSSFGAVKKELCQSCHTAGAARQDCLLCHTYHVNGVVTPIMSTKVPAE